MQRHAFLLNKARKVYFHLIGAKPHVYEINNYIFVLQGKLLVVFNIFVVVCVSESHTKPLKTHS